MLNLIKISLITFDISINLFIVFKEKTYLNEHSESIYGAYPPVHTIE